MRWVVGAESHCLKFELKSDFDPSSQLGLCLNLMFINCLLPCLFVLAPREQMLSICCCHILKKHALYSFAYNLASAKQLNLPKCTLICLKAKSVKLKPKLGTISLSITNLFEITYLKANKNDHCLANQTTFIKRANHGILVTNFQSFQSNITI